MENKNLANIQPVEKIEDRYNQPAPNLLAQKKPKRWGSLDLARGIAIILMVLSHSVKGLMHHSRIPDWGLVPVHLLTKFSSSLFILVFGVSLSLYFLPHVGKKTWSKKRYWMIKRGIELMVWYKALTIVQMFQYYPKQMVIDTLLFKRMPDFVEILGFYAIALIWLPFFLPLWNRMNAPTKIATIVGTFAAGQWLHYNFDFWGYDILKVILVEEKGYYTFGQLQRGALIFLGLFVGDLYKSTVQRNPNDSKAPLSLAFMGSMMIIYFCIRNVQSLPQAFKDISSNVGKHPFTTDFLLFSVGGAFCVLGLCLLAKEKFISFVKPISYLGRHSLNAFILHIIIIFYFYRYYFDLHYKVSYYQSLGLTALCVASIIVLMFLWTKTKAVLKK